MVNSPEMFANASDDEKEVAKIMLQLCILWIRWGAKRRRSALEESPSLSHQSLPSVASKLETPSENPKPGNDDQRIAFMEKNSSQVRVEPTTPCDPQYKVIRLKIKPPSKTRNAEKQIKVEDEHPRPEGVMIMENICNERAKEELEEGLGNLDEEEQGLLVRGSEIVNAEPSTAPEGNNISVPPGKHAKRKTKEEMEADVAFLEQKNLQVVESIEKVKEYLEKRKALYLRLRTLKQQKQVGIPGSQKIDSEEDSTEQS